MNETLKAKYLRVATYFANHGHYSLFNVYSNPNGTLEFWLVSKEVKDYPAIRISASPLHLWNNDEQRFDLIKASMAEKLQCSISKVLDIHVGQEQVESQDYPGIHQMSLDEDFFSGSLPEEFEGLSQLDLHVEPEKKPDLSRQRTLLERTQKQVRNQRAQIINRGIPIVSCIIAAICILVFILLHVLSGKIGSDVNAAIVCGALYKAFILGGHEFWRFLTSGFVHIDLWHLLCNLISLMNLGYICEHVYGRKAYATILFLSILGGSAFVYIGAANGVTLGLSGGLYGLLAALLVYGFDSQMIKNPAVARDFIFLIGINLAISFMPGISLLAHVGGFITGGLLAIAFTKNPNWLNLRRNAFASFVVLCGCLVVGCFRVNTIQPAYPGTDRAVYAVYDSFGWNDYASSLETKMDAIYAKGE